MIALLIVAVIVLILVVKNVSKNQLRRWEEVMRSESGKTTTKT